MDVSPRFRSFFFGQTLNSIGIPFLFGCLIFALLSDLLALVLVCGIFVVLLLLGICFRKTGFFSIFLLALVGLALCVIVVGVQRQKDARLSDQYDQKCVTVSGVVTRCSDQEFDLSARLPHRAKIRVKSDRLPKVGDMVQVTLTLSSRVSDAWKQENVDLKGVLQNDFQVKGSHIGYAFLGNLRRSIADAFGGSREGGFLRAVLLSDRTRLSQLDTETFRRIASSHLIAISGLHITQFLAVFAWMIRIFGIGQRKRALLMIPIILFLFFITQGTVSVFRAVVMAILPLIADFFFRPGDSVTALVFAACLLAVQNVQILTCASFVLSFSSTFGILVAGSVLCEGITLRFQESKIGKKEILAKWCFALFCLFIISLSAFVFSFPFQLLLFGESVVLAPLFSLILPPMFSLCLALGMLTCFAFFIRPIGTFFLWVSRSMVGAFLRFCDTLASAAPPALELGDVSALAAMVLILILVALMATRRKVISVLYVFLGILIASMVLLPIF